MRPAITDLAASTFHFELLGQRNFLGAADVDRMPLMNRGCRDIENPPGAARAAPAGLFRNHRERCEFVEQPELAFGLAALRDFAGIHVDPAFEDASMEIRGERATVAKRVAGALVLAAGDMRDEFTRALVPLSPVSLVHRVGAAMRRHLHVFLPQDKLAKAAIEREDIDAVASGVDELRAG